MNLWTIEWFILAYFVVSMSWNYMQMILARRQLKWADKLEDPEEWPDITILIPAFNEELVISDSVASMLAVDYPGDLKVAICDDGSTDDTFHLLQDEYDLKQDDDDPNLYTSERVRVIRRENGGRAAALNSALSIARSEYIVATDADTLLDRTGLRKIVKHMVHDPKLEAVGGTIMLANNIKRREDGTVVGAVPWSPITGTQAVEYLRSFLYGRLGLNRLGGNVIISGAFGVFRRLTVSEIGGWNEDTVAEDFDLTIRLRAQGGKVLFISDPVAWTEAPSNLISLGKQRERWHRGLTQMMLGPCRKMYFRKKYGGMGMIVLPMYFLTEWLAPLVEVFGVLLIGSHIVFWNLGLATATIVFSLAFLIGVSLSVISIWMEQSKYRRYVGLGDTVRLIKYSLAEPFWYRPLTIYWRLKGLVNYLRGKKDYGEMARKGFFVPMLALAVAASITLASPKPLEAQWIEVENYREMGQDFDRNDLAVRGMYGSIVGGAMWRNRGGIDDVQFFLSKDVLNIEGTAFNIGLAGSAKQMFFPAFEMSWGLTFTSGKFVNTFGARYQSLKNLDITLQALTMYQNTLDFYTGDWRISNRIMVAGAASIFGYVGSVSRYYERFNWTMYVSAGNELIDIPSIVAFVEEAGVVTRWRFSNPLELSMVTAVGERGTKRYFLGMLGLRNYF